jgi:uncharacterized protein YjbI with pentapeptide repeats
MANAEHIIILKQGVRIWNEWREHNPDIAPDLSRVEFSNALNDANLSAVNFRKANLSGSFLYMANLNGADLIGANLSEANLGWVKFVEAKLDGASLNRARLDCANFSGARLVGAKLIGASLWEATLDHASFMSAKLNGANLADTSLQQTDFTHADLSDTNLTTAHMFNTEFYGANLSNADFSDAHIIGCTFAHNDLSTVKGLETAHYYGPSEVGINTLYNSGGKISEVFLRGCGVPDDFIAYLPSLVGIEDAIQFYSCFISYSHKDGEFAKHLHSRMRDANLRVWFAPEDVKGGEKLHEQIDQAIQIHDRLLLVLSENSMRSEWVMTEIRKARRTEMKEKRRKLFPIRLVDFETIREWECFDADSGKDLACEVREYFIPDFSNWKDNEAFEAAFRKLLKDLKAARINDSRTAIPGDA